MSTTLIGIIIIIIVAIIAVIILILVLRYKGSSSTRCTAQGQCAQGSFCNGDGFCVVGGGATEGQTCSTTSNCVIGLGCFSGTCQIPSVLLTPGGAVVTTTASTSGSTSSSNSNNFLTTSGQITVLDENTELSLTNVPSDEKISDLQNYISTGDKPSYISTANSFNGQTISVETTHGKYYLQINLDGAYWIHSSSFSSAQNVKLSYDKNTKFLSANSKKTYLATSSQSKQIKFSNNKYYLQTTVTNNDSRLIIERNSNGYFIRTPNGRYLTIDLSGANVVYAKYPAILATFDQLNSEVSIPYLQLGAYVK